MREIFFNAWMGETACYFDEQYQLQPNESDDARDKYFLQKDISSFKGSSLEYLVTDNLVLYVHWYPYPPQNHELIIEKFVKGYTVKGNYDD